MAPTCRQETWSISASMPWTASACRSSSPAIANVTAVSSTLSAFGYGATEEQALVGVLGELSEKAQADTALRCMERITGSYRDPAATRGASGVCYPLTLCLPAGSDSTPD